MKYDTDEHYHRIAGKHRKCQPLQIHKRRITQYSRIGMKYPKGDDIEYHIEEDRSYQRPEHLNSLHHPIELLIDEHSGEKYDSAIYQYDTPIW